jgi:hypothetical protein
MTIIGVIVVAVIVEGSHDVDEVVRRAKNLNIATHHKPANILTSTQALNV